MYYTPPALADRMLDMVESSGIEWKAARVLDPACGGGAFLLPTAMRMRAALAHLVPELQIDAITSRLCGFEIDPFGAWLSQAWLEIGLSDILVL
jgi:adenine-specific DNA-methyltransferase